MKIGLVNDYPPASGIGNYAFSLFSELERMNKDVDMLYLQYKEPLEISDEHIKVIETPFKLPVLTKTLNWYYYFPKKIPEGYDIYHVSSQYLSKVAKYRKPCVVSCMDIFPAILERDYSYPLRVMVKKALRYLEEADAIITISEYSKKELVDKLKIPSEKISVVYLGVDTNTFRPIDRREARGKLGLPPDKKIILHVGSEEPRKNIEGLIKAFYDLQKKIPESLLIRIGEKRPSSWKLIEDLGLEGRVCYFEALSPEDLTLAYNASDVLTFPSFYEGFGLPVLEAMACGIPVITSNTSSLPEIVRGSGSMIDPGNYEELTTAINNILTDETLHQHLIDAGIKNVASFSWKKTTERTIKVYEEVFHGD